MSEIQKGFLATQFGYNLPLEVLESGAGYYIGTFSPTDGPVTRESEEYYSSYLDAKKALVNRLWKQRMHL